METSRQPNPGLPIKSKLSLVYGLTFAITGVMVAASIAGLLYHDVVYPTEELANSFVPNVMAYSVRTGRCISGEMINYHEPSSNPKWVSDR